MFENLYKPNSEKEKKQTWDKSSNIEFFKRQINNPYDSTKKFFSLIAKNVDLNNSTTLLDALFWKWICSNLRC